jgi:hypothetical protein
MEFINLIDYLDKPELIQHENGTGVRAIHHFPEKVPSERILVVFENGATNSYYTDGSFLEDKTKKFILKPKPKIAITGWRRGVLYPDGCFDKAPMFSPSKEAFVDSSKGFTLFGPWESETIEIEDK